MVPQNSCVKHLSLFLCLTMNSVHWSLLQSIEFRNCYTRFLDQTLTFAFILKWLHNIPESNSDICPYVKIFTQNSCVKHCSLPLYRNGYTWFLNQTRTFAFILKLLQKIHASNIERCLYIETVTQDSCVKNWSLPSYRNGNWRFLWQTLIFACILK